MPIELSFEAGGSVVVFRATGRVGFEEWSAALERYFAHPSLARDVDQLADLSEADLELGADEMKRLAAQVARRRDDLGTRYRAATVTKRPVVHGQMRMYSAYADDSPVDAGYFDETEPARARLGADRSERRPRRPPARPPSPLSAARLMIPAMERDDLRTRGAFVGALDVRIDPFLASAGSRSLAAIVDTLIVLLIISFVLALLTLAGPLLGQMATGTMASIAALVVFLAQWFYFVACEQLMGGQSPGKRICGLRVVMDDGTAPGLLASLIRNLLRPIDLMPAFYGVGVVTLFLNDRGKRVGDLAAGTIVVREAKADAGASPPTPTRWPERLGADDVRLVEGYFRAAETMADGPREEAARLLVEWIRQEHAAFAEGVDTQLAWSRQARLIFGVTPSARTG